MDGAGIGNPVPSNERKRARKHASKQVLATEPRPSTSAAKKVRPDIPVAAAATPALWIWCPIHETSSHDVTDYRSLYNMVEKYKKRFAEHVAIGTTCNCFGYGQPVNILRDCPGKVARRGGTGGRGGGQEGARGICGGNRSNQERAP
jgi:hypothetical protein